MVDWKVILSAVLLVVVLVIALSLRTKIERNKDSEGGIFRPYRLRVEGEENENGEDEDGEEDGEDEEDEDEERGDETE